MAPIRTQSKQPRNKLAMKKSGTSDSKAAKRKPVNDGIVKKKKKVGGAPATTTALGRPSLVQAPLKRKRRTYSEKELDVPKLNMITPIGVIKPPGRKKGKEFVDDAESMATIMAIVQAEKEGQIESKVMKARRMEEIREARRMEADKNEKERLEKLNKIKDSMRKKRKRKGKGEEKGKDNGGSDDVSGGIKVINSALLKEEKPQKRVSFAV